MAQWAGTDGDVALAVAEQAERVLQTYRADPRRVEQDANIERSTFGGAYATRQVFELMQNAADALRGDPGRCEVLLTSRALYVANAGAPVTVDGVRTLMASHVSGKRDEQIGRFGLGFKSVLAVSDAPMVISRTGSFIFDRAWSEQKLREQGLESEHYPAARLARVIDPAHAQQEDVELAALMRWASTVVVVPVARHLPVLQSSVQKFPAEFLLFSPQVTRLDLEDRSTGHARRVQAKVTTGEVELDEAGRRSTWAVATRRHTPSSAALADGGYQAARNTVDVSWAMPVSGSRQRVGEFWAYFPTGDQTTLSGVVNAPWKLADDRSSLLEGRFNDEILVDVLPRLVAETISRVHGPDRPTAGIDALPARGKEARSYGDDRLNKPVMDAVAATPCIPSMAGKLRHPSRIKLHPEEATAEELMLWSQACPDPEEWVHHDVQSPERRAKVLRLMNAHGKAATSIKEWLEHLVRRNPCVTTSGAAVRILASLITRRADLGSELVNARVLLLSDGTVDSCRPGQVFLPGGSAHEGALIIDDLLGADPEVTDALSTLGLTVMDDSGALRNELSGPVQEISWPRVWASSRKSGVQDAVEVFRDVLGDRLLTALRVQTRAGTWRAPGLVYLPGRIVDESHPGDHGVMVHPTFHQQDLELLRALGLVDAPQRLEKAPPESWRSARIQELRERFRAKYNRAKIHDASIHVDTGRTAWPLEPLKELSPEARARATHHIVQQLSGDERWRVTAGDRQTQRESYHDLTWAYLADHGCLETAIGPQPVKRCLAHNDDYAVMDGVRQPLPFVGPEITGSHAERLRLRQLEDLQPQDWAALVDAAGALPPQERVLSYAWAALYELPAPTRLKAEHGRGHIELPPGEIAVTTDQRVHDRLLENGEAVLLASSSDDAETLMDKWGLQDGTALLVENVECTRAGEEFVAADRFPPLRLSLSPEFADLRVQPCSSIHVMTSSPKGRTSDEVQTRLERGLLLSTASDDEGLLRDILRTAGSTTSAKAVLTRMSDMQQKQLVADIRRAPTVDEKLLLAVGREKLQHAISAPALEALRDELGRDLDDLEIAQLAHAAAGYGVLREFKTALEQAQLDPPSQWAGGRAARDFVASLGFPSEYAGAPGQPRRPEEEIPGRPTLGDLHDYQRRIADNIKKVVAQTSGRRRGLVPLPTGAGKTRVAAQALVEHMQEAGGDVRVVWIAETDELCEQAVGTWSDVWRAAGSGLPLTISRLWSGNEANERDGLHLVVASTSKLSAIDARGGFGEKYAWLVRPAVIVVDEAHRSISPAYTQVLSRLGGSSGVRGVTTPLIGLTATPYRGHSSEETRRLAERYDHNLLDAEAFPDDDVYGHLTAKGVLAAVDHTLLNGAAIELTAEERRQLDAVGRFPSSAEGRLGRDAERNATIVRSVAQLPPDSRVLLFATSVENARVLASLLTFRDIEARAVAGEDDVASRRRYVEDFRQGRIRVLTNYNVFAEGFDVPGVDAVYLTRPTFSPNLYQQMIGRGLRGPLNGGKPRVKVVNVADNVTNYGEELAFRHFQHVWDRKA